MDEAPKTGEHPATTVEVGRKLNLQTLVILISIIGSVIGGARFVVVETWAQGKEHVDAGIEVLDAKFQAHIKEESQSRQQVLQQLGDYRVELREMRQEQRAIYDYMKTGREQPALEKPLPPLQRDGGK